MCNDSMLEILKDYIEPLISEVAPPGVGMCVHVHSSLPIAHVCVHVHSSLPIAHVCVHVHSSLPIAHVCVHEHIGTLACWQTMHTLTHVYM